MTKKRAEELAKKFVQFDKEAGSVSLKGDSGDITFQLVSGKTLKEVKASWADAMWLIELVLKEGETEGLRAAEKAKKILLEGLKYHEHDGHDMPKRVARDALKALGVTEEDQP